MAALIRVIQDDIANLDIEVIVNAANSSLLGGLGVDGVIHKAAGPNLLDECRKLKGCITGHAKITNGYNLRAKYVIHTVGPVWNGGLADEETLLASCYLNSLNLAVQVDATCIAFPCISTGAFGFPQDRAATIAFNTVRHALDNFPSMDLVVFCCNSRIDFHLYKTLLKA